MKTSFASDRIAKSLLGPSFRFLPQTHRRACLRAAWHGAEAAEEGGERLGVARDRPQRARRAIGDVRQEAEVRNVHGGALIFVLEIGAWQISDIISSCFIEGGKRAAETATTKKRRARVSGGRP